MEMLQRGMRRGKEGREGETETNRVNRSDRDRVTKTENNGEERKTDGQTDTRRTSERDREAGRTGKRLGGGGEGENPNN